jgi:hypothetical protein
VIFHKRLYRRIHLKIDRKYPSTLTKPVQTVKLFNRCAPFKSLSEENANPDRIRELFGSDPAPQAEGSEGAGAPEQRLLVILRRFIKSV